MTAPVETQPRQGPPVRYPDAASALAAGSAAQAGRIYAQLVASTLDAASPSVLALLTAALVTHLLRGNRAARRLAAIRVRTEVVVHLGRPAPILLTGPPTEAERRRLTAAVGTLVRRAVEAAPPAAARPAPADTGRAEALRLSRAADEEAARLADREAALAEDARLERARVGARALERRASRAARAAGRRTATRERRRGARAARSAERREAREDAEAFAEFEREAAAESRRDAAVLARISARDEAEERDRVRRDLEADSRSQRRAEGRAAEAARRAQQVARLERLAAAESLQAGRDAVLESAARHVEVIEEVYEGVGDVADVIEGWIRVLNGESCERCEQWADGKVRPLGQHMKWHVSCDCTARLVWTEEYENGGLTLTDLDEPVATKRDAFVEVG